MTTGGKVHALSLDTFWSLHSQQLIPLPGELNDEIGFFPANRIRLETEQEEQCMYDIIGSLARHTNTLSILPVAEQQQQQHAFTGNDTTLYQQQQQHPSLISTDIGNGAMSNESEKPALPPRDIRNRTSYIAPRESLDELPEGWQHAYGESFFTMDDMHGWVMMVYSSFA